VLILFLEADVLGLELPEKIVKNSEFIKAEII